MKVGATDASENAQVRIAPGGGVALKASSRGELDVMKIRIRAAAMSAAFAVAVLGVSSSVAAAADAKTSAVERGRYVAIAGNCVSCHTKDGGQPYAGGRAFPTPFGTMYSTNLTPDSATGIGTWSEADLAKALREGLRPNGEHLYPAFPYTAYTKMSDEDVSALYAYLKSLKPVASTTPENQLKFPYNQRWALGLWKMLYFDEGRFTPDAGKSPQWNRGAYLVEALAHCGACHSPRDFLGGQSDDDAYTGGEYLDRVPSGEYKEWSAPNLTSASNGLSAWPVDELAAYLKTGRNSFTDTFGPMNEVIMNSTRHLSPDDVRAMAEYLKSLPAHSGSGKAAVDEELLAEGWPLYDVKCGTCHQPDGMGSEHEDAGARLVGSPIVLASNPAALINTIMYGPERPNPPLPHRWKEMPGFGDELTDEEMAAIATFVRNSWGHEAGAVSAEQVRKQR